MDVVRFREWGVKLNTRDLGVGFPFLRTPEYLKVLETVTAIVVRQGTRGSAN